MADPKSNDAPASAAKAAGTSAAVKPPVLEGKARPARDKAAAPESPGPGPAASKPADPETRTDAAAARPAAGTSGPTPPAGRSSGATPWIAGLVGGALGLGAAYGLAVSGYWPVPAQAPPVADARLDDLAAALPEVRTVADTTQSELSRLTQRVAALESAGGADAGADLAERIAELGARVDSLAAAGPEAAEAASDANSAAIVALQADVTALQDRTGALATSVEEATARLESLSRTLSEIGSDESGIVRLPLLIDALDAAFAGGQPFADELALLARIRPETSIPAPLDAAAATGLPAADDLGRRLDAALPDMLAARPMAADAGWQGATADWFRSILALRPSGPVEGDGPDAILARLEDALSRQDIAAADAAFATLPPAMQAAAGDLGTDLARLAAARQFLSALRAAALAEGTSP